MPKTREEKLEYHRAYNKKYYLGKGGTRYKTEKYKESRKEYYNTSKGRLPTLIRGAVTRSKRDGKDYDLDALNELLVNTPTNCQCCGVEFEHTIRRRNVYSIDRVDNTKGYVKGNIKLICDRCNRRKSDMGIEELQNIINYIRSNTTY